MPRGVLRLPRRLPAQLPAWGGQERVGPLRGLVHQIPEGIGRRIRFWRLELRDGIAERLDFADGSLDAVVSTLVLCSVRDLPGTLREIRRVLKPGGRFIFLEHVAAPAATWLRRVQRWVRPPWRALTDGCCPDRETWLVLENAGFARVYYERFRVPIPIASPHIAGLAIKEAAKA